MAKILLVDDSALSRKLLMKIIDKTEHEIVGEAESGEKAILMVRKVKPDIIMMDLDMPGMGGLEAGIKIMAHYPSIKIIIVSAHEQGAITNELKDHGLIHFISKPIKVEKVLNAFQKIFSEQCNNKEVVIPNKKDNNEIDVIPNKKDNNEKNIIPNEKGNIDEDILPNKKEKLSIEEKSLTDEKDLFLGLDIKDGSKVAVTHFSSSQDLQAQILLKEKNELTIKFIKEYPIFNFSVDEPITICFGSKGENYICEANIVVINSSDKNLKIYVTKINNLADEQLRELFPISLQINIKEEFQTKNLAAIIKNIGVYNLQLKANFELYEASKVILDIYLDNKAFIITAEITTKVKTGSNFEYGVKVTFIDFNSKRFLASSILKLRNQRIDSILGLEKE